MPARFHAFGAQVRAWWPIITAILTFSTLGVIAAAKAADTIQTHETRLDAVEHVQGDIRTRLAVIEARTSNTDRAVVRLEDKVDRLLERDR